MKINASPLYDYLAATLENSKFHAFKQPQLMSMVNEMDQIFHDEIFNYEFDISPVAGLLAMNSYMMLLNAIQQALTGHTVSIFPIVRAAIESAMYAYLIADDESNEKIWLNRNTSKSAKDKCGKAFSAKNAEKKLKLISPEMATYVKENYDASIDYGAHPNRRSIYSHLIDTGLVSDRFHSFTLNGVYERNSREVNNALLACIEFGQAIAFLIAACDKNHPIICERVNVFQGWIDKKNLLVEDMLTN